MIRPSRAQVKRSRELAARAKARAARQKAAAEGVPLSALEMLTEQQKDELRSCFTSFDQDCSGYLCAVAPFPSTCSALTFSLGCPISALSELGEIAQALELTGVATSKEEVGRSWLAFSAVRTCACIAGASVDLFLRVADAACRLNVLAPGRSRRPSWRSTRSTRMATEMAR